MKRPMYPRKAPVVVTLKRKPTLVVNKSAHPDAKTEIAAKLRAEIAAERKR